MPKPTNDNAGSAIAFEAVIKRAISDWARQKSKATPIVVDEAVAAGLALLITYRLMRARLVTFERTHAPADDPPAS